MRTLRFGAVAVLALSMLAAQPAQAQGPVDVTLEVTSPAEPINATGPTAVPVSVTVGCAAIVQNQGSGDITFTVADAPAWLTVSSPDPPLAADLGPTCLTNMNGAVVVSGDLLLTPSADAPGLNATTVNVVASVGETPSEAVPLEFMVAFRAGYTLVPDIQFPYEATGDEVRFNVTVTVTANARSMVMVEETSASAGTFSGLASQVYEVDEGPRVFPVIFTAPSGDWTESNVTFYAYNHYLLPTGESGDPELEMRPTWTFTNGGDGGPGGGGGKGKDSPGLPPMAVAIAVAAAAMLLRSRRD